MNPSQTTTQQIQNTTQQIVLQQAQQPYTPGTQQTAPHPETLVAILIFLVLAVATSLLALRWLNRRT